MMPCKPNKVFKEKSWAKKEERKNNKLNMGRGKQMGNGWIGIEEISQVKLMLSSTQGDAPDFMTRLENDGCSKQSN